MSSNRSEPIDSHSYYNIDDQHNINVDSKTGRNSGIITGQVKGNLLNVQTYNSFDREVVNAPDDAYERFMEALAPYDAYEHLTTIRRVKAYVPGTCEWIVKHEVYIKWRDEGAQVSWLVGGPAIGKTVLCAYVVHHLMEMNKEPYADESVAREGEMRDQSAGRIAYYFCDSSSPARTSLNGILGGLLRQLLIDGKNLFAKSRAVSPQNIETVIKSNSLDALWNFFREILHNIPRKVYVIVDALDECDSVEAEQFLELLNSDIRTHRIGSHVKFMISTRPDKWNASYDIKDITVSLTIESSNLNVESDVHRVIRQKLSKFNLSTTVGSEKAIQIEDALIKKSGRTFLWVHLVVDNLIPKIRNDQDLQAILGMLAELPPGLPAIYDKILWKICRHDFDRAAFILPFVATALSPLKAADVDMAFAIWKESITTERIPRIIIADVYQSCMPFVFCDHETSTVHLVHASAKEYLLSHRPMAVLEKVERFRLLSAVVATLAIILQYVLSAAIFSRFGLFRVQSAPTRISESLDPVSNPFVAINGRKSRSLFPQQKSYLSQSAGFNLCQVSVDQANLYALHVSLSYLEKENFDRGNNVIKREQGQRLREVFDKLPENERTPFGQYAARNWAQHAMAVDPHYAVQYLRQSAHLTTLETLRDKLLLDAAEYGNSVVLRFLVNEMGARVNVADTNGRTALHLAALGGELGIVRFLIEHGANQHTEDEIGANATHWAVRGGHVEIFRYLVAQRLHIEYNTWFTYWNAKYPFGIVHDLIVLLDPSILTTRHYEMPDDQGATLLVWAIECGSKELVDFLLARRVHINYLYQVHPSRVFPSRHVTIDEVLENLEEHIEDVGSSGAAKSDWLFEGGSRTPLSRAASKGQDSVVKALLDRGADRHIKDNMGRTPVYWASKRGHKSTASLLITEKIDRQNQLAIAVRTNDLRAVKNLIEFGISDPNKSVSSQREWHIDSLYTPTIIAACIGNEEALKIMLEHPETRADLPGPGGMTPLACAALLGRDRTLSLLLGNERVKIDSRDYEMRTPLMVAIQGNEEHIVRLLLGSNKADTRLKDCSGMTALSMAARWGNKAIFDMISARGTIFNLVDSTHRTALFFAVQGGNHEIVESILSDPTVSVMAKDVYGAIPLTIAARRGDTVSAAMLLGENASAQLRHKDNFGMTALAWAAYSGHAGVRDFISQKCKEFGFSTEDENICPIIRRVKRGNGTLIRYCIVCFLTFGNGEAVYSCFKCWRGRFLICDDCQNRLKPQPGCLQETHKFKQVQGGSRKLS